MTTIKPTETLVYYDGVQVFAGRDPIGGHYMGMMIDTIDKVDRYLVAGVSPEQLRQFRAGMLDLRALFLEAPGGEWFITRPANQPEDKLVLVPQSGSLLASGFLPDDGFVLADLSVHEMALQRARERGNVVFEFSTDPPESAADHRIRMTTLAGVLSHLQAVVRHAYRNAVRDLSASKKTLLDTPDGHLMDVVVPASPGSFRVQLEAARPPDMFGHGELVRALKRMDQVFACADAPEEAEARLQPYRGHLAGSYINLIQFLSTHDTGLRYEWADPWVAETHNGGVSQAIARQLADSLSAVTSLSTERVTHVGKLIRVNLRTGDWGLSTQGDRRAAGKIADYGPGLSGLVIGERYRFECEEDIQVDAIGNEKHTLYVQDISPA